MPKTYPPQSLDELRFSREDVELLASIKGGQEALIQQVNSLQTSMRSEAEARRKQMEDQRKHHEEQLKAINTRLAEIDLWRATTLTIDRIASWDDAAKEVSNFKQRYKGIVWAWSIITAALALGGGWIVTHIITPLFQGGK